MAVLLGLAFALTACGPREISDKKMQAIIHDVFMVNAYQSLYNGGKIDLDSVDLYRPILESYGYDAEDFRYTLDRWALKKSSRLSQLIDDATADIQSEHEYYVSRQRMRDRVDTLILDYNRDTVYHRIDSLSVRRLRDKDSLTLTLPMPPGDYRIRYRYYFDSEERDAYANMRYYQQDDKGENVTTGSRSLGRASDRWIDVSFTADAKADSLRLLLADLSANAKEFVFRADSLEITHNEPIETARRNYLDAMLRREIGPDYPYEFDFPPKDSGALCVVPPLRPDTARHTDL